MIDTPRTSTAYRADGEGEDGGVALSHLDMIKEILAHTWHAPILRALATGPLRYSRIGPALVEQVADRPGDGYISEELRKLQALGLIARQPVTGARHHVWALTDDGRHAVDTLHSLVNSIGQQETVGRRTSAAAEPDSSTAPTGSADSHPQSAVTTLSERDPGQADRLPRQRRQPAPPGAGDPMTGAAGQQRPPDLAEILAKLDTSQPHPARRYNYWLGGKDNFAADRASGDEIAKMMPSVRTAAIENRRFQRRAVRFLAGEAGIRQFLDIGTGIPGPDNTHEVAQAFDPTCRVVYVDNDPVVLAHARALLTSAPEGATAYIEADLRQPEKIISQPDLPSTLDLTQPVGLLLVAVLHFLTDDDDPYRVVGTLVRAMPAGSYLAVTNITQDFMTQAERDAANAAAASGRHGAVRFRTKDEFARFFDGTELVPPGIQPVAEWRSEGEPQARPSPRDAALYAAVGKIRHHEEDRTG